MAKRRERPVENPLRRDLVSSITGASSPPASSPMLIAEPELPAVPVMVPEPPVRSWPAAEEQGGRATEEPEAHVPHKLPQKWQRSTVTMKTRFVPAEARQNAEFTEMLGRLMRAPGDGHDKRKVTESHVTRALWSLARRASDDLEALVSKAPKLRRPPHGDSIATAEFEDAIADYLLVALKRMRRAD